VVVPHPRPLSAQVSRGCWSITDGVAAHGLRAWTPSGCCPSGCCLSAQLGCDSLAVRIDIHRKPRCRSCRQLGVRAACPTCCRAHALSLPATCRAAPLTPLATSRRVHFAAAIACGGRLRKSSRRQRVHASCARQVARSTPRGHGGRRAAPGRRVTLLASEPFTRRVRHRAGQVGSS
jgi:hypothetical protein